MTLTTRPAAALAAALSLGLVAALLWHFHDRFWWPADDGVYAYVAWRIIEGDHPHLDFIDLHAGYGNLANVAAFRLFGLDLVSLRYPLAVATLVQSAIVFALFVRFGALVAAAGTLAVGSFSFIQFLDPSANWYALFLFFVTAALLGRLDPPDWRGLIAIGLLVGLTFFVRQLSGVILALGVVSWLVCKSPPTEGRGRAGGLAIIAIMTTGLGAYLWSKASLFGFLWAGLWPLGILAVVAFRSRVSTAQAARLSLFLGLGVVLAGLPLLIQHAAAGAIVPWLRDVFLTALLIHSQPFIDDLNFGYLLVGALARPSAFGDPVSILHSLFWVAVLAIVPATGILTLLRLWNPGQAAAIAPLPVLAVFWGVVALHYQIPIYLYFALPASISALLWLAPRRAMAVGAISLSVWATVFHAGQPLSRALIGTIEGRRVPLDATEGLPRASLHLEAEDQAVFARLLDRIASQARPGERLLAIPIDPELNFMSERTSPLPYYSTALGLRSEADVTEALERIVDAAPLFVVHRRGDKYMTPLAELLLARIRALAPPPESIGPFDLYRLPANPPDPPG